MRSRKHRPGWWRRGLVFKSLGWKEASLGAFFFAPNARVVGKRIVETVPAVSRQDILGLINQDEALENERKASQMGEQTIDDAR